MPALASKDSEKAPDYLANPDSVLTLNISKFIVTIQSAPSTRYGLTQELRSTFNWHQSPTPYSQIFTLTASHHPTALCANAGSLLELLAALQQGLAAQILESSEIYGVSVFIGAIDMVRVGHPEIQGQAWVKGTAWLKVCDNCGHARTQILAVRVDG